MRKIEISVLLGILLLSFLTTIVTAQEGQTVPITPPPTRKIEAPPATASAGELEERGDQLRGEKAYLDALDYYQAAIKKMPKGIATSVVWNKAGMAQIQMARFEDAKSSFEKAIKLAPAFSSAHIALGSTYLKLKDFERARAELEAGVKLKPDDAKAHYNLALLYARLKDQQRAQEEMRLVEQLKSTGKAEEKESEILAPSTSSPK